MELLVSGIQIISNFCENIEIFLSAIIIQKDWIYLA